jgi:hypothetical protein
MRWVLRHTIAIVVLPVTVVVLVVTVVVLVPAWLARSNDVAIGLSDSPLQWVGALLGVGALIAGSSLFVSRVRRFGAEGKGTLAPHVSERCGPS